MLNRIINHRFKVFIMSIQAYQNRFESVTSLTATKDNVLKIFPFLLDADPNFATLQTWEVISMLCDTLTADTIDETAQSMVTLPTVRTENFKGTVASYTIPFSLTVNHSIKNCAGYASPSEIKNLVLAWHSEMVDHANNKRANANIHQFLCCDVLPHHNQIYSIECYTTAKSKTAGKSKQFFKSQGKLKQRSIADGKAENFKANQAKPEMVMLWDVTDVDFNWQDHLIKLIVNGKTIYNRYRKLFQIEKDQAKLSENNLASKARTVNKIGNTIESVAVTDKSTNTVTIDLKLPESSWLQRFSVNGILTAKLSLHTQGLVTLTPCIGLIKPITLGNVIATKVNKLIWHDTIQGKDYSRLLNRNNLNDLQTVLTNDYGYNRTGIVINGYQCIYNGKVICRAKDKFETIKKFVPSQKIMILVGSGISETVKVRKEIIAYKKEDKEITTEHKEFIQTAIDLTSTFFRYIQTTDKRGTVKRDKCEQWRYIEKIIHSKLINPNGLDTAKEDKKILKDIHRMLSVILPVYLGDRYTIHKLEPIKNLLIAQFNCDYVNLRNYLASSFSYIKGKHDDNTAWNNLRLSLDLKLGM